MDRSSVARSGLHSITSSARVAELAIRTTPQGKVWYWVSLTAAEFGSDIELIPRAYLNNEPLPDYRHCRGAHHYGLNGLALPMARHLIIGRRSAPR